jgi:hypothetical protein
VIGGKTVALDPLVLDVGEITGVVLDNASRGVPGAFVRLTRTGTAAADTPVRDARTDDLGRFRFTALDVAEALSIHVVGQALTAARLERAFPRAEPYELRLTRLPQITLTVTRGERLYDGPLLVSVASRPVGTDHTLTSMNPAWMTCVSGLLSFSMPSAGTYAVQVRTAEEEPAEASGVTTTDAADPTVMRATLDLRVPDPAAPDGGRLPGK